MQNPHRYMDDEPMDEQTYDLRQKTTVTSYAQAKDLLQDYENRITRHINGVQALSTTRIRQILVQLSRIQLKCPTLKHVNV